MADGKPIKEAAKEASTALDETVVSLESLKMILGETGEFFDGFGDTLEKYSTKIANSKSLTNQQADAFGVLAATIRDSKQMFSNFSTAQEITASGFKMQTEAVLKQAEQFIKLKGSTEGAGKIMFDFISKIKSTGLGMAENADNAMRLQKGIINLAGSTGDLSTIFAAAGQDLENMGAIVEAQGNSMLASAAATNTSMSEIEKYQNVLGKIPGALNAVVKSNASGTESTSMLTAAIKVAHGTGRTFEEVMTDVAKAYDTYGLKGEEALKFTVRMTDVTNALGAKFTSVQTALHGVAESFGGVVDEGAAAARMAEGNTRIMYEYANALKATHISGDRAIGIAATMIKQMQGLDTAQKAFVSAQSGGPGGLLGSVQIEKLLREGKSEEVMKMVDQTMRRQFGKIMTIDDVKSESDAIKLQSQRLMLLKGPLGEFAKTQADADRILEAFKSGSLSDIKLPGGDTALQDTMERGTKVEDQTTTEISRLYNFFEQSDFKAAMSSLKAIQTSQGARNIFNVTQDNIRATDELRKDKEDAAKMSGNLANLFTRSMEGKEGEVGLKLQQQNVEFTDETMKGGKKGLKRILPGLKATAGKFLAMGLSSEQKIDEQSKYDAEIQKENIEAQKLQEEISKMREQKKSAEDIAKKQQNLTILQSGIKSKQDYTKILQNPTAFNTLIETEDELKNSARNSASTVSEQNAAADKAGAAAATSTEAAATQRLEVTAICYGCQTKLQTGQLQATAPGTRGGP